MGLLQKLLLAEDVFLHVLNAICKFSYCNPVIILFLVDVANSKVPINCKSFLVTVANLIGGEQKYNNGDSTLVILKG